jgi:hypothetical protein
MRPTRHSLARFAAALVIAGSAGLHVSLVSAGFLSSDPAKPYLGMSKEAIVACAGEPHARYKSGANAETLTYHYSGAGPVPGAPGGKKKEKLNILGGKDKKKGDKGWSCTASLVFEEGRLARVSFAHKNTRSPYAWQKEKDPKKREAMRKAEVPTCSFALPNCSPAR